MPPTAERPDEPDLPEPTEGQVLHWLRLAQEQARRAVQAGRHPFGALLIDEDGCTVLLEQSNVSRVEHAEAVLAREAARRLPPGRLARCTLVTTVEPCAMCAGTQYWAGIGRLVYGLSESRLREFTGADPENPTLDLPCRRVFEAGAWPVQVIGPVPAMQDEIETLHRGYWKPPVAPGASS